MSEQRSDAIFANHVYVCPNVSESQKTIWILCLHLSYPGWQDSISQLSLHTAYRFCLVLWSHPSYLVGESELCSAWARDARSEMLSATRHLTRIAAAQERWLRTNVGEQTAGRRGEAESPATLLPTRSHTPSKGGDENRKTAPTSLCVQTKGHVDRQLCF